METNSNVEAIIAAAREAIEVKQLADGRQAIVAPTDFRVHVYGHEGLEPIRDRIVASPVFHDGDSLAAYAARFKTSDTLLVGDINKSTMVVKLDYHGAAAPAAVDHTATWRVQHSEEFAEWSKLNGKLIEQGEFLRFLEEHASDIVSPEPASVLELVRDFSAMKSVKFQSSKRLDNGDRALVYQEETGTKSGVTIPQKLRFHMPIYWGEEAVNFEAWFRYRIADGALFLGFEFHRIEPIKQAAFRAAVTRVAESAGLDPFYGEA